MAAENVRVGIIGAGYAGGIHAARLARCGSTTVVGVCDPVLERAANLARPFGALTLSDIERLSDIDCLYICTPPHQHLQIVRFAIDRGIPFLLEKPLAPDLSAARELADAVSGQSLINAVGYHWRYRSDVDAARAFLDSQEILLANLRWIDTRPSASWWSDVRLSGGQVVEQATHLLDLSRILLGEVVDVGAAAHVQRTSGSEFHDSTVAYLTFASGALGTLAVTCGMETALPPALEIVTAAGSLTIFEGSVTWSGKGDFEPPACADPYLAETEAFISAVRAGNPTPVKIDVPEALRTHSLACRVHSEATDHLAR